MRGVDFLLLFLAGLGAQAPWWSLSTAADFFDAALPNRRSEFWLGATYAVAISIALPINLSLSNHSRLWAVGVFSTFLMLFSLSFFVVLSTVAMSTDVGFWLSITFCALSNFGSALFLSALYTLFASKHARCSLVVQVSGVTCALLLGVLRVVLAFTSIEIVRSGIVFFSCSLFLVVVAMVSFVVLQRRHHGKIEEAKYSPLISATEEIKTESSSYATTLKESWLPLVSLFMDFTILFFCYPGLMSAIHCENSRQFQTFSFLIFNGADAVGKFLPILFVLAPKATLVLAILEWIVFLVLYAGSLPLKAFNEAFFSSDAFAYVLTGLLGLWHGYLCCSCFVLAPQIATDKSRAGTLSFVFNTSGILIGSALSFILAYYVIPLYC